MRHLHDLKEMILPRICPVCGKRSTTGDSALCIPCMAMLPRHMDRRADDNLMIREVWQGIPAEEASSLFQYSRKSRYHNIIMRIKQPDGKRLARQMGMVAGQNMLRYGMEKDIDLLVPVPLSFVSRISRMYNQSKAIAQGISEVTHIPVCDCLSCKLVHKRQKRLGKLQRMLNAQSAYKAHIPPQYRGSRILLIDDVFTTGSTMTGCARALLEDDANVRISLFSLAR